jgi:long-chain fatty acid transport protein
MRTLRIGALAAGIALAAGGAQATNGYMSHGYGTVSKSLAGACVAIVESAMCGAHNPAVLGFMDSRLELGVALFSPDRGFRANDDGWAPGDPLPPFPSIPASDYDSDNDLFLIPHFAYNRRIDDQLALGLLVGGNGGMNTEYDSAVFRNFNNPAGSASSPTGIDLIQMFVGLNAAYRLNESHAVALMPILMVQRFEAQGLEPFRAFSRHPDAVTDQGSDWSFGFGARVGWLWQVNDALNVGASYQSRIYARPFEKYEGLFAEGGDFDIPPMLDLGAAIRVHPDWTLSLAYQRVWYGDINAVGNPADLFFFDPTTPRLGADDGLGFGWKDVDVYKVGVQWRYQPDLSLRAGYSHATEAVPGSQALFNILAPAVVQDHWTFGLTKALDRQNDINVSFMYAPEEKVRGTNPNTGPQTGFLRMDQWDLEVSWVKHF